MGVAVVMSLPAGEATQIVKDTGCGVCIAPEDPKSLADELVRLADNHEITAEYSSAGIAAAPSYSRDTLARKMLEILETFSATR